MPLLALVCQYARQRREVQGSDSAVKKVFPRPQWLADLAASHDLSNLLSTRHGVQAKESEAHCVVLAKVKRGAEYMGPLTQWSREEDLLWEHFGFPKDAFTLRVSKAVFVQPALAVVNPQRKKIPFWLPTVAIDVRGIEGFLIPHLEGGQGASGGRKVGANKSLEFLEVNEHQFAEFAAHPLCLALPAVLVELLKRGAWKSLMMQGRWCPKLQRDAVFKQFSAEVGLPSQAWLAALQTSGQIQKHVLLNKSAMQLTPEFACTLASEIRRSWPSMLNGKEGDDLLEGKLFLEEAFLRLSSFASAGFGGASSSFTNGKAHPDAIVKALLAAMNLRDRSQLGETFQLAFESMFPGSRHRKEGAEFKVLSAATLSRKQIEVDCAFACFWRDRLSRHTGPIYVYADSSPQAGSD